MSAEYPTREQILEHMREAIRASANGRPPGSKAFAKQCGVTPVQVKRYWPNHSKLIEEAGAAPNDPKRKIPDDELFREFAKVCQHVREIPGLALLRISTRELGTRTHKVQAHFKGGLTEFKAHFKQWVLTRSPEYDELLVLPGWERKSFGTGKRVADQIPPMPSVPYTYLPVGLVHLNVLASDRLPPQLVGGPPASLLFEQKCAEAFRALGFQVRPLGQGKGRKADCLAIARAERFGVVIDAKARAEGFVLGTEDRKLVEYAKTHSADLRREGIERIYLCVVSSSFREKDVAALRQALTGTDIHGWSLWTAEVLMTTIDRSIAERAEFSLGALEQQFRLNSIA